MAAAVTPKTEAYEIELDFTERNGEMPTLLQQCVRVYLKSLDYKSLCARIHIYIGLSISSELPFQPRFRIKYKWITRFSPLVFVPYTISASCVFFVPLDDLYFSVVDDEDVQSVFRLYNGYKLIPRFFVMMDSSPPVSDQETKETHESLPARSLPSTGATPEESITVDSESRALEVQVEALVRDTGIPEEEEKKDEKNRECIQFYKYGVCSRSTRCIFLHTPHKNRPCPYLLRGKCVDSDSKCAFSHDRKILEQKPSPLECTLCGKFFTSESQLKSHQAGKSHLHFEQVRQLNHYVMEKPYRPTERACFNCYETNHIRKHCPWGFCRYFANRECRNVLHCCLPHIVFKD